MKNPDDIGIVCLDHLGDAVLKSGFVQAVRSKWPAASICMFCTDRTSEYWRLCRHIDRVRLARPIGPGETIFAWESEKKPFDLVIAPRAAPDYAGCHFLVRATKAPIRIGFRQIHFIRGEDCNQAFTQLVDLRQDGIEHAAVSPARLLTALTSESDPLPLPSVSVGPEARQWAERELPAGSWLAIGLGAAFPHKMWPPEAFAQAAGKFAERGWGVVLIGSAPERPLTPRFLGRLSPAARVHPVINLVGDTGIEEMAAVLERCSLFIGNDSGPKHVAAALRKPVVEVSWINCDDPALRYDRNFAAFGTRAIVVRPPRKFTPQETFAGEAVCSVPVGMVVDAAETLLKDFHRMISIVLPSRLARFPGRERFFLEDAVRSIRAQTIAGQVTQIIVGIDAGAVPPAGLAERLGVAFANADGKGQAAALNAAAARAEGDYLAFLEDDDAWHPPFLEIALDALKQADFASSTQLEVDERGDVLRILDFPTPSGWVMPHATFQAVGFFSTSYRWHLDNEWLGRLAGGGHRRVHLVEATAPVNPEFFDQMRPWLGNVLRNGGPSVRLVRHKHLQPLVVRRAHWNSGTQIISRDEALKDESRAELTQLQEKYGHMPW